MLYNFSFIIPHKNCPDLLQRCVDSIPEREDVQIIVVDDNSEEGKKPSLKEHKNLQVILLDMSQSRGAGRARNVGLKHAKGKWLLFSDADDYYTDYLQTLLDKYADDETTDIVYLNACKFDENGNISPHNTNKLITNYLSNVEGAEMDLRYNLWTPWSRMVKKSVIDSNFIWFDELPAGNDLMFGLKSSRYSKTLRVEENVIYMYFRPSMGSCTDAARKQMFESRLALRSEMITLYKEVGYDYKTSLFVIVWDNIRKSKGSVIETVKIYIKTLSLYNISLSSDLKRFFS